MRKIVVLGIEVTLVVFFTVAGFWCLEKHHTVDLHIRSQVCLLCIALSLRDQLSLSETTEVTLVVFFAI